jgi:hypothetical protein
MPKIATQTMRGSPSATEVAKRILGTGGGAELRLRVVTAYLEKEPEARAAIEARIARAASRPSASGARDLEIARAEIVSRAEVRYAFEVAPAAAARVRNALADYLGGPVQRPSPQDSPR